MENMLRLIQFLIPKLNVLVKLLKMIWSWSN